MFANPSCPIIALEEHFWDEELTKHYPSGSEGTRRQQLLDRLYDIGDLRLREMDAAGIDMQVLSHGPPATQKLPPDIAIDLSRSVNDRLHTAIERHPDRFSGFAALPTAAPEAAAKELERCVKQLGFKGTMIHGQTNGLFHDDKQFWPIFECAERLGVPVYLHPSFPNPAVYDAYYKDYVDDYPMVIRAAWGYTVETATQAIRLILSGIFDAYPKLQIILGHLGETLPFLVHRIDEALSRPGHKPMSFREIFTNNFHITTSGNFSTPALLCCAMELGIERIMFSVDYPFVANDPGPKWMETVPMSAKDKERILCKNAQALLRL